MVLWVVTGEDAYDGREYTALAERGGECSRTQTIARDSWHALRQPTPESGEGWERG